MNFLLLLGSSRLEVLLLLRGRGFKFFYFAVLFKELIKQHRVNGFVAPCRSNRGLPGRDPLSYLFIDCIALATERSRCVYSYSAPSDALATSVLVARFASTFSSCVSRASLASSRASRAVSFSS